ncbi:protein-disulfide reductase DsbD domain-containing protein [Oryzibacter oryziterrae]|uniref:protein-disulfide reductase DsbD domain-containing protein n=1 Tax=Oryzibacter oryziterrae TaxID=2766474 RepID=UPI001F376920|nr:protein-disulfide reductase DsbD domain-containing protein [Oryzibacter oryziterrae]
MNSLSAPFIALIAFSLPAAAAQPAIPEANVSLIAAGPPAADGSYRAGLVIDIPQGWHTYWENPGDAGIPPQFDFAASSNVQNAVVAYPAPERYFDGVNTSMVYTGRLVLPLTVTPTSPGDTVTLSVHLQYGLCAEVCVPAEADAAVDLAPDMAADATATADIAAAAARVPVPARAEDKRVTLASRSLDAASTLASLTVSVADDGDFLDLFVTGTDDWYASPPEPVGSADGRRLYKVALSGSSAAKDPAGVVLRFVVVGKTRSWDAPITLD